MRKQAWDAAKKKRKDDYTPWENFFLLEMSIIPWISLPCLIVFFGGFFILMDEERRYLRSSSSEPFRGPRVQCVCLDTPCLGLFYLVLFGAGLALTVINNDHMLDVQTDVPVALPDPDSSGLNQFLTESNLTLYRCTLPRFHFYVGFPDSCPQLGDPYSGMSAKLLDKIEDVTVDRFRDVDPRPKSEAEKRGAFSIVWLVLGVPSVFLTLPVTIFEGIRVAWHYSRWIVKERGNATRCHPVEEKDNLRFTDL